VNLLSLGELGSQFRTGALIAYFWSELCIY